MSIIANQLVVKRKQLGLTQQSLAQLAQVSLPTVQNIESGRGNPSLDVLTKISRAIGLRLVLEATDGTGEVNWDLLTNLGVPLSDKAAKSKVRPDSQALLLELRKAVVGSVSSPDDRKVEALCATLLSLKSHWPSIYRSLGPLRSKADQLIARQNPDRLLKLRPLATSRLQVYL